MSNYHRTTGNNIPGYFLGRPRSLYIDRFAKSASVVDIDDTKVVGPAAQAA